MDLNKLAIGISVIGSATVSILLLLLAGIAFWGFDPMPTAFGAMGVVLTGVLSTYFFVKKNISN